MPRTGSRELSQTRVLTQASSFGSAVFGDARAGDVGKWIRGYYVPAVDKGAASYVGLTIQVKDSTGAWRGVAVGYAAASVYGIATLAPLQVTAPGAWVLSSTSGGSAMRFLVPGEWRLRASPSGGTANSINVDVVLESEFE